MGKLECMTVNYPPTFNPNNEKIIEIEEKSSSITVKSNVRYARTPGTGAQLEPVPCILL